MNYNDMQKITRGYSNFRRIRILDELEKQPNLSVNDIAECIDTNYKTTSDHVRKLVSAGLVDESYKGQFNVHSLSQRGNYVLMFLRGLK